MARIFKCNSCNGKGRIIVRSQKAFERLTFVVPKASAKNIFDELDRLSDIAGIKIQDPCVRRGAALELMAVNSSLTSEEELA